ncbi:hypothetical protein [Nonomuraea dietziae]|uniref:hypothetical protein n=1 Tax=Nonomuraea dietziae TaxID=65515 RepID=UPI0031DB9360
MERNSRKLKREIGQKKTDCNKIREGVGVLGVEEGKKVGNRSNKRRIRIRDTTSIGKRWDKDTRKKIVA